MKLKWLLLFLPVTLSAQANHGKHGVKGIPAGREQFVFHMLTMDDFITTSPEKGGTVIYKYDSTGLKIEGEIVIDPVRKIIEIVYSSDKKHALKAAIDGSPKYDAFYESCTYKAHWLDTDEKTEITLGSNDTSRVVKVLYGPHNGNYTHYWDRIYRYIVSAK